MFFFLLELAFSRLFLRQFLFENFFPIEVFASAFSSLQLIYSVYSFQSFKLPWLRSVRTSVDINFISHLAHCFVDSFYVNFISNYKSKTATKSITRFFYFVLLNWANIYDVKCCSLPLLILLTCFSFRFAYLGTCILVLRDGVVSYTWLWLENDSFWNGVTNFWLESTEQLNWTESNWFLIWT